MSGMLKETLFSTMAVHEGGGGFNHPTPTCFIDYEFNL